MRTRILSAICAVALAPFISTEGRSAEPIRIAAEKLAKECSADARKAKDKYAGKVLSVTGVVGSVYDDILYLPIQLGGGATSDVGIRYGKGNMPAVKTGDTAMFEAEFNRVAVLGPALVEGKLVADGEKVKKQQVYFGRRSGF